MSYVKLIERGKHPWRTVTTNPGYVPEFASLYDENGKGVIKIELMEVIKMVTRNGFKVVSGSWNDFYDPTFYNIIHTVVLHKYAE